jgi:hypothetical protein
MTTQLPTRSTPPPASNGHPPVKTPAGLPEEVFYTEDTFVDQVFRAIGMFSVPINLARPTPIAPFLKTILNPLPLICIFGVMFLASRQFGRPGLERLSIWFLGLAIASLTALYSLV